MDVSDGTNNTTVQANTITNLGSQSVILKHSAADASAAGDADGVTHTITGATDTTDDTINVTVEAIDTTANQKGIDILNVGNYETVNLTSINICNCERGRYPNCYIGKTINLSGDGDLTVSVVAVHLQRLMLAL